MLRHVLRSFRLVLKFPQPTTSTTAATATYLTSARQNLMCLRCFVQQTVEHAKDDELKTERTVENSTTPFESSSDAGYITSYHVENEQLISEQKLIKTLQSYFRLTNEDIKRIINDDAVQRAHKQRNLVCTLEKLLQHGVSKRSFISYPWLLTLDSTRLDAKIELLHTLYIRDINHFAPFLRLTVSRLNKLVHSLKREAGYVPTGNRLYFISDKMQTDPEIVAKYLHKRLFILEMPFDMLERNLEYMLEYKVAPENILKDLWAFRYKPKSVKNRLERAKIAKKGKLMPWMVRCPESILQKTLQNNLNELKVLGDKSSSVEYVAERLGFSVNETKSIMDKHPNVHTVRVTKIKEVLDYLLNEAGYTRHEIAMVPRILCHSLETTKKRLEELKSYGCRPSTLIIVCRSKREYQKFVNSWLQQNKGITQRFNNDADAPST